MVEANRSADQHLLDVALLNHFSVSCHLANAPEKTCISSSVKVSRARKKKQNGLFRHNKKRPHPYMTGGMDMVFVHRGCGKGDLCSNLFVLISEE